MTGFVEPPMSSLSTFTLSVIASPLSTIPSLFSCLSPTRGYEILEVGVKSGYILNLDGTGYGEVLRYGVLIAS